MNEIHRKVNGVVLPFANYVTKASQLTVNNGRTIQEEFDATQTVDLLVLLAKDWQERDGYFYQTLSLPRIKSTDTPTISMGAPNVRTAAEYKAMIKAYGLINYAETSEGAITFYCYIKKPATSINVLVKGV